MAFPSSPLDLRCELDLGGTQTDVSSYVYQRDGVSPPVELQRGRADESATANPGSARWQWNNRDGRFSPANPLSPFYGLLGRNTPVRWSIPAQVNYLRIETDTASYVQAPDAAPLDITGDTDIRIDFKPSDYRFAALCGKNSGGSGPSWLLERHGDGTLVFFWWDSGGTGHTVQSTAPVPYGRVAARVTLSVATGTVTFWTAPSISGTWTQLGAANSGTGGASTSVFAGTAPLRVGDNSSASYGSYYAFELLDGIGGTAAANPDFTAQAPGAASFADAAGNTWTLAGTAEISGRDYRWHGEMSSLPPKWDVSGTDHYVAATAGGPLRRMQQGQAPPVMSPVRRGYLQLPASEMLVAYWPAEDAAGATAFGSATGGQAMYFSGSPQLASGSSFIASSPLPVINGAVLHGKVPGYTGGTACIFRFLLNEAASAIANGTVIARMVTTGTIGWADLAYDSGGGLTLTGYSPSGAVLFTLGPVSFGLDGGNWLLEMVLGASGSNLAYAINGMTPGAASQVGLSGVLSSAVPGNVTDVYAAPLGGVGQVTMGHFAVQAHYDPTQLQSFSQPLNAWQGETAGNRFARLAGENGYAARILGAPDTSAAMGAQAIDTLANLLQACEDADDGQVFEPRQQLALGYRTLATMYNQSPVVAADYSQAQPGGADGSADDSGLDPAIDDQLTRNDWTLTRSAGSGASGSTYQAQLDDGSAMSISPPPAGVGDYGDTKTVNVQTDDQLQDLAWWKIHVGTVIGARWPVIPWNLARPAVLNGGLYYPLADADIGDFAELSNLPDVVLYDPVKQLVYGTKESLGGFHHAVEWNCVPELPYEVAADGLGYHVDTDGSELVSAVTATATALPVQGHPWTENAADFPFDVGVAGERMTVTGIGASSRPGSRTGAYLDQNNFQQADFNGLRTLWTGWGASMPVTRYYAGNNLNYTANMGEIAAAGVRMCLDFEPSYNPPSAADRAAITATLATLAAAGADVIVSIWHEPYYDGLTAAQYVAAVQFYAPAIRAYYPLFCSFGGPDATASNGYYPGDAYCDGIALDIYLTGGFSYTSNSLTQAAAIADAAWKPLAIWELGTTQGPNYLAGDNTTFAATIGQWVAAGASAAHAAITNPFGVDTGALQMTCTTAGNITAASAANANYATQMQACSPGDEIFAGAWVQAGTTGRTCIVGAGFYSSTGTPLGAVYSTDSSATITDTAGTWTPVCGKVTAPASAAYYAVHVQAQSAALGEVHYAGIAFGADSTSTGHTQGGATFFWQWVQSFMGARLAAGKANGDIIAFNAGIPGNSNVNAILYSNDYRIALINALYAALDSTSYPQQLTVTRSVNGVVKSQAAGTAVALWQTPIAAL